MAQQQSLALPWTAQTVASLATAIASGVLTVSYGEGTGMKHVTYRSLKDMQGLLDRMVRYVNSQGDGQPLPNVRGSVYIPR